jgi:hypothetical protein
MVENGNEEIWRVTLDHLSLEGLKERNKDGSPENHDE